MRIRFLYLPSLSVLLAATFSNSSANATGLGELPVKAIPQRSTLVIQKDLLFPANHARVNFSAPYDLNCFLDVHPISNRTRMIRAGSIFYVTESGEDPPRVQVESRRNTLLTFACEPRPETLRGGNMDEFFFRYADRMNLNYDLSVKRFEGIFRGLFRLEYSDPIEIEANAHVLKESPPPTQIPARETPPKSDAPPSLPLKPAT